LDWAKEFTFEPGQKNNNVALDALEEKNNFHSKAKGTINRI
jgi:hypothetical protein